MQRPRITVLTLVIFTANLELAVSGYAIWRHSQRYNAIAERQQ